MKSRFPLLVAFLLGAVSPQVTFGASVLEFKATATAGLNAQTIALIEGLPAEIRKQAISLNREAQP